LIETNGTPNARWTCPIVALPGTMSCLPNIRRLAMSFFPWVMSRTCP
jgi:hypothetical protein